MFTGIVDHCGVIRHARPTEKSLVLEVETRFSDLVEGESISVDGACLTVIRPSQGVFTCDLSSETLRLTLAGSYREGTRVNLERALRFSDRLGGHIVTGHVDGKGRLARLEKSEDFVKMSFAGVSPEAQRFLMKKGSVTVNGVSLTVNEVFQEAFSVMLIPHTLERTNLGALEENSTVNLEFDWLMKVFLNDKEMPWKKH